MKQVADWRSEGEIDDQAYEGAVALLDEPPPYGPSLHWLAVVAGTVQILAGIVFFFAYNWAALGKFAKLGLIGGAFIICITAAAMLQVRDLRGRTFLFAAAVLIGVFWAVFGQVYQSKADAHWLFLTWGLLVTPIMLKSRFIELWLLVFALLLTWLFLLQGQVLNPRFEITNEGFAAWMTMLMVMLVAWQELAQRDRITGLGVTHLGTFPWILAVAFAGIPTAYLQIDLQFQPAQMINFLQGLLVLGGGGWYAYRHQTFVRLAVCELAALAVVLVMIGSNMNLFGQGAESLLVMALLIALGIGLVSAHLMNVRRQFGSEHA